MDPTKLTTIVSLLAALSVASERLVEIVKGLIPSWLGGTWLKEQKTDPTQEGYRTAVLQVLAVVAGVVTATVASGAIPQNVGIPNDWTGRFVLGLLASGGSGFWNSILTYAKSAKDIKAADAESKKIDLQTKQPAVPAGGG